MRHSKYLRVFLTTTILSGAALRAGAVTVDVVHKTKDAVVNISTTKTVARRGSVAERRGSSRGTSSCNWGGIACGRWKICPD